MNILNLEKFGHLVIAMNSISVCRDDFPDNNLNIQLLHIHQHTSEHYTDL